MTAETKKPDEGEGEQKKKEELNPLWAERLTERQGKKFDTLLRAQGIEKKTRDEIAAVLKQRKDEMFLNRQDLEADSHLKNLGVDEHAREEIRKMIRDKKHGSVGEELPGPSVWENMIASNSSKRRITTFFKQKMHDLRESFPKWLKGEGAWYNPVAFGSRRVNNMLDHPYYTALAGITGAIGLGSLWWAAPPAVIVPWAINAYKNRSDAKSSSGHGSGSGHP